jgi:hypothetical protein
MAALRDRIAFLAAAIVYVSLMNSSETQSMLVMSNGGNAQMLDANRKRYKHSRSTPGSAERSSSQVNDGRARSLAMPEFATWRECAWFKCRKRFEPGKYTNQHRRGGGRHHRGALYCSRSCQQKAYRLRRDTAATEGGATVTTDSGATVTKTQVVTVARTATQGTVTRPEQRIENIEVFSTKNDHARPPIGPTMYGRDDLVWDFPHLRLRSKCGRILATIENGRIRMPDGTISADHYNITWAKENAIKLALSDLNRREPIRKAA